MELFFNSVQRCRLVMLAMLPMYSTFFKTGLFSSILPCTGAFRWLEAVIASTTSLHRQVRKKALLQQCGQAMQTGDAGDLPMQIFFQSSPVFSKSGCNVNTWAMTLHQRTCELAIASSPFHRAAIELRLCVIIATTAKNGCKPPKNP